LKKRSNHVRNLPN